MTGGLDAQGEAVVEVEYDGRKLSGRGLSTNVIEASAQAFLQVVNRIALRQVATAPQADRPRPTGSGADGVTAVSRDAKRSASRRRPRDVTRSASRRG